MVSPPGEKSFRAGSIEGISVSSGSGKDERGSEEEDAEWSALWFDGAGIRRALGVECKPML
jgi:hypothetical protein